METLGVLLVHPIMPYMQEELNKRFKLFKYWEAPNRKQFLAQNCDAIKAVVGNTVIGADSELIESLPNLEIVSTFSVGLDKVDLVKCRERGIKVTNTPDVLTDDVADLAIGLILATLRRLCASDRYVRNGLWKSKGDFRLTTKFSGKSLGQGRISSAIAKRAEAFVCPISYHSKSEKLNSKITYYSNITDLAANSQILVVACRLTQETHCIINCTVMEVLGPKGVLVHIGHGSIVYGPELVSALLDGLLGGVGLDAFEHKPGPPGEFFRLDNVVLLLHVGSHMWETGKDMTDLVVRNLEVYALNKSPLTPVLRGARAKGIR